jgi:hypothetical protein
VNRTELLELWNDMWNEGNWVPSWRDSLAGITAAEAAWSTDANCHSIWQEVVHVAFWRRVTIDRMADGAPLDEETIARLEFAVPAEAGEEAWAATVEVLKQTQDAVAMAIQDESKDIARIPYHLIHDAYHLGRITQIRGMQGSKPKF